MPCGRCRQLLYEFGGDELLVDTPRGIEPMSTVLPQAFGPQHLQ
jgi:cytidine deaminase